jgi:hypothetical protein
MVKRLTGLRTVTCSNTEPDTDFHDRGVSVVFISPSNQIPERQFKLCQGGFLSQSFELVVH